MLKIKDVWWVNNGFTSCVTFDHKAHRHGDGQLCQHFPCVYTFAAERMRCCVLISVVPLMVGKQLKYGQPFRQSY